MNTDNTSPCVNPTDEPVELFGTAIEGINQPLTYFKFRDKTWVPARQVDRVLNEYMEMVKGLKAELQQYKEGKKITLTELVCEGIGWVVAADLKPTHNRAVPIRPSIKGCEFACYNSYEDCWDTEDGDDYLCDYDAVKYWCDVPPAPED